MRRTIAAVLGLAVAGALGVAQLTGGNSVDTPEVGEAPMLGGPTPLAPEGMDEDPEDMVPFIEGEPTYDLNSIPVYDENLNLITDP